MSSRKKSDGHTATPKPIIIHQPSPYPQTSVYGQWEPPGKPSSLYHGDAEAHVPVVFNDPSLTTALGKRAGALDALRGLFLLSMTLGFAIQPEVFATWMYHRQFPPPGHGFVDLAGISWRDVTYGAFLFSMAAAVPITLARRVARGATEFSIIGAALRRGFMLFAFALLIGHSNTYFIGYTQTGRALAILGFFITFFVFTRPRKDWNQDRFARIQAFAWVAAILFLALSPLLYGETFKFSRVDEIISELGFAAVTGWTIWYFTRNSIPARLAVLGVVTALFLASHQDGSAIQRFWYSSPLPFLFENSALVLLCVVIPGTIAGDMILRWMNTPDSPDSASGAVAWLAWRGIALTLLALAATPIVVVGMYHRAVMETTIALAVLSAVALALAWRTSTPTERLIRQLFVWSTVWLMLGMATEPLFGGMRKVPDNLSYFFTMAGVSMLLLNAATIITDLLKASRSLQFLTDVGQNPMLCYILFSVFMNSLLEMIPPARSWMLGSPTTSFIRSVIMMLIVGLITREFTRRRIFWRA